MAQFNKVILVGHLVKDPELRQTNSGESVTSFSLAVNRTGKNGECDFFDITAWRKTAELVANYLKKGSPVLVCGRLQNRSWQDKQGNKRTVTEVVADEVAFIGSREASAETAPAEAKYGAGAPYMPEAYGFANTVGAQFEDLPKDTERLPF